MTSPIFTGAMFSSDPFPHVRLPAVLDEAQAADTLRWLDRDAPWHLRIEDFYEQHEFSLMEAELGSAIRPLAEPAFTIKLQHAIQRIFSLSAIPALVEITAHRLTPGQTIRVHNDFIEGTETHRLLIQLNSGWVPENGGLLMLFRSASPDDVHSLVLPRHASGFAFEISPQSFHAVSTIKHGQRYTLVYSFRA